MTPISEEQAGTEKCTVGPSLIPQSLATLQTQLPPLDEDDSDCGSAAPSVFSEGTLPTRPASPCTVYSDIDDAEPVNAPQIVQPPTARHEPVDPQAKSSRDRYDMPSLWEDYTKSLVETHPAHGRPCTLAVWRN